MDEKTVEISLDEYRSLLMESARVEFVAQYIMKKESYSIDKDLLLNYLGYGKEVDE